MHTFSSRPGISTHLGRVSRQDRGKTALLLSGSQFADLAGPFGDAPPTFIIKSFPPHDPGDLGWATIRRAFAQALQAGSSREAEHSELTMTPLRRRMIQDMQLRNFAPRTITVYVNCVSRFARHLT